MSSGILKLIEVTNLEYVENPTSHSFALSKYKTFRKNLAFVLFGVTEKFLASATSQKFWPFTSFVQIIRPAKQILKSTNVFFE